MFKLASPSAFFGWLDRGSKPMGRWVLRSLGHLGPRGPLGLLSLLGPLGPRLPSDLKNTKKYCVLNFDVRGVQKASDFAKILSRATRALFWVI